MKRRILAAVLAMLFASACSQPSNGSGNGACDQFAGGKKASCQSGMSDVHSALDQLEGNG